MISNNYSVNDLLIKYNRDSFTPPPPSAPQTYNYVFCDILEQCHAQPNNLFIEYLICKTLNTQVENI